MSSGITQIRGITALLSTWPLRGILKFAGITAPNSFTPTPPPTGGFILMEDGSFILLEDGVSKILLEA